MEDSLSGEANGDGRSDVGGRLDSDRAAVGENHLAHDEEAQADAVPPARLSCVVRMDRRHGHGTAAGNVPLL